MAAINNHKPTDYRHRDRVEIKRALLSVSDKTGLLDLAKALHEAGVAMVSTGSTAKTIADAGYEVTEVSQVTGFPESLDGRVKTLHPKIHGGLLADMRLIDHEQQLAELDIEAFQLVVVNLYPFMQTVASGAKGEAVVDQIDIGGPAMVRASAKNHANVAIVVEPTRYPEIIAALGEGGTTLNQRRQLAANAFAHTARYDSAVADWFADELSSQWKAEAGQTNDNETKNPGFPAKLTLEGELVNILRRELGFDDQVFFTRYHIKYVRARLEHAQNLTPHAHVIGDARRVPSLAHEAQLIGRVGDAGVDRLGLAPIERHRVPRQHLAAIAVVDRDAVLFVVGRHAALRSLARRTLAAPRPLRPPRHSSASSTRSHALA